MSSNPSPTVAALLSLLFPGLGQAYAGEPRRGLIWAIPMFAVIAYGLLLIMGGSAALATFLSADKLLALLIFDVVFLLYHVVAMIDAYNIARRRAVAAGTAPRSGTVALAALISVAVVVFGLPATVVILPTYNFAVSQGGHPSVLPQSSFAHVTLAPATPGASVPVGSLPISTETPITTLAPGQTQTPDTSEPTDTPTPSRDPNASIKPKNCPAAPDLTGWAPAADGRLDVVLVGSDSRSDDGVSSASLRTDSMLLLSVDIAECKAALFSFPRNLTDVPEDSITRYPDWLTIPTESGVPYNGYLFGLWRAAADKPGDFPGSEGIGNECDQDFGCERGWRALTYAIEQMSGVNVDGVIAVNLKGFVDIVENLPGGGVWLDIPAPLSDDAYYNSQQQLYPVNFQKGCQFLGPEDTLAYSRSRHQDSDYQRERRQQFVLQSIRKQLDPISLLPHIGGLLTAVGQNIFMTFSSDDFPYLAQVASRVDADRLYQYDFAPAHLVPLGSMQGMQAKVQNIFSEPEPDPTPQQQGNNCPPRN